MTRFVVRLYIHFIYCVFLEAYFLLKICFQFLIFLLLTVITICMAIDYSYEIPNSMFSEIMREKQTSKSEKKTIDSTPRSSQKTTKELPQKSTQEIISELGQQSTRKSMNIFRQMGSKNSKKSATMKTSVSFESYNSNTYFTHYFSSNNLPSFFKNSNNINL